MTRKPLKLGFTDTHEHLAKFFDYVLSQRYDVEIDNENPEFLIFGDENFGIDNRKFSRKDVVKIFYTGENRRADDYDCDYAITFDHHVLSPWHYRLPLYIIYMWSLEHIHQTKFKFDSILHSESLLNEPKTDFCSFVVSNPGCHERNEMFEFLNSKQKVNSAGRHLKNVSDVLKTEEDKIRFLSKHKFNICFESGSYPGYVTEKILHAFYAGTIPIYWGSPTVYLDFNPKAFLDTSMFRSKEELWEIVSMLDKNDALYNEVVSQPKFIGNVPPSYYAFDNFLNWFDATVYQRINKRHHEDTIIYF
jgi:hypothetical protein